MRNEIKKATTTTTTRTATTQVVMAEYVCVFALKYTNGRVWCERKAAKSSETHNTKIEANILNLVFFFLSIYSKARYKFECLCRVFVSFDTFSIVRKRFAYGKNGCCAFHFSFAQLIFYGWTGPHVICATFAIRSHRIWEVAETAWSTTSNQRAKSVLTNCILLIFQWNASQ